MISKELDSLRTSLFRCFICEGFAKSAMRPELPSSPAFCVMSRAYRDAGDAVLSLIRKGYIGEVDFPSLFLYLRSIELALKAVLVANGVKEREITRELKHQISALLRRAADFVELSELEIHSEDRQLLDDYSRDYSDKWFEYPHNLRRGDSRLEQLSKLAHRVCDKVRTYTKQARERQRHPRKG